MNSKHRVDVKEIDEFFNELLMRCQQKDCCFIVKTIESMGVTYEEAQKWAALDENWAYKFEWCHTLCTYHAEQAGLLE